MRAKWAGASAVWAIATIAAAGCTQGSSGPHRDAATYDASVGSGDSGFDPDAFSAEDAHVTRDAFLSDDSATNDAAVLTCDGAMIVLPDPSAVDGVDTTEPASCTGCPSFTSLTVTPSGTTVSITGTVAGSTTCSWYVVSPSCGGTTGMFAPDPEFGMFSRTLPLFCGANRIQLVCENASGRTVTSRTIDGPACSGRDVQITLTWGDTSNDQELHLVREGFHINDAMNDCTWFTCVHASPDWGVAGDPADDPHKDVDWLSTFGPENIYLTRAAPGRYEVMVEYWGSGTTDAPNVTIQLGGATVWMGSHTMNLYDVWDVGTIVMPGPTFVPADTITPCASAWRAGGSFGCGLPIP
jgi:hypothetical protein